MKIMELVEAEGEGALVKIGNDVEVIGCAYIG